MTQVNPEILRWARETAGLDIDEATRRLGIKDVRGISAVSRLAMLEAGNAEPTRPLLVKMAKQYRRPLLTFYLPAPPRQGDRGQDFRTLHEGVRAQDGALVDALIRDVTARQSILRAALIDEDEAEPLPFVGSFSIADGHDVVARSIRETIGFDLDKFREQRTTLKAFAVLRLAAESAGIFVLLIGDLGSHHTAIPVEAFRGFVIADDIAPFIIINDQDARAAWSFTLAHELAHLWLGHTGISGPYSDQPIEAFCNNAAGEMLLPDKEVDQLRIPPSTDFAETMSRISDFATERNISRSMVAYRLFRNGSLSKTTWQQLREAYREHWTEHKRERRKAARERNGGGPSYYTVRRQRIGANLINLVQRMMAGGALTSTKAGLVLGVKPQNLQKLMETGPSRS